MGNNGESEKQDEQEGFVSSCEFPFRSGRIKLFVLTPTHPSAFFFCNLKPSFFCVPRILDPIRPWDCRLPYLEFPASRTLLLPRYYVYYYQVGK